MTRYAKSKQEALREHIHKFCLENQSRVENFTFLHFKAEMMSKSTVYGIIQRRAGLSTSWSPGLPVLKFNSGLK